MLIFLIRPLSVFIGTENSGLDIKQKLLLSWIAPRGIVAAAVASLFVYELEMHGFDGTQLRALVFLLIIITVLLAGLTGGFIAGQLDLKRKSQSGWIILGAHEVSRILSRLLKKAGFVNIQRLDPYSSSIPNWSKYQLDVVENEVDGPFALYIEAQII